MNRAMKDSGIPWIGEIPEGWEVARIKNVIEQSKDGIRIGPFGSSLTGKVNSDGDYKVYGQWNIVGNDFNAGKNFISSETFENLISYKIVSGDILISMMGTVGKCAIIPNNVSPGIMDSHVVKTRLNLARILPRYFAFVYDKDNSNIIYNQILKYKRGSIMDGLNSSLIKSFKLPLPPVAEQEAIAAFLDRKCGEVDEMVSLQEQVIEELKAYKQSVITEAVTKGLNPSAPMKPTNIDWIGQIPTHWTQIRLKFLCTIQTGDSDTQDAEQEGEYPFYVRSPKIERSTKYTFDGEGILMAGDGAGAGRVFHHAFGKYAVHQRVYRLANFSNINTDYLFYFISSLFCKLMDRGSAQSTVPSVRLPMLTNFVVCIPPLSEQGEIADYLDRKCADIDALIALKQQKIEDLKQYKKSLIYEYVTGKKQVFPS